MHLSGGRLDYVASFSLFSNIKGPEKHGCPMRSCEQTIRKTNKQILGMLFASHAATMVGKNVKQVTRRAGEKVLLNRVCTFDGLLLHIWTNICTQGPLVRYF